MAAAIGLREMRRQPIRPAVGALEDVDGRADVVGLGTAFPIASPLFLDLAGSVAGGDVLRSEAAGTGCGEQQRIFDARANSKQALASEAVKKAALLRVSRWH